MAHSRLRRGSELLPRKLEPVRGGVFSPRALALPWPSQFTTLGRLPAPEAGYSTITKLYVDRYGVPPASMRVFIRTRQALNGWEDLPQQTTAIVPR